MYVTYKGTRIEGILDLRSERLRITRGPESLVGQTFKTPTPAAVAVVRTISPTRKRPQTNGWRFWRDADSGELIHDTLRER